MVQLNERARSNRRGRFPLIHSPYKKEHTNLDIRIDKTQHESGFFLVASHIIMPSSKEREEEPELLWEARVV